VTVSRSLAVALEVLDFTLVLLGRRAGIERPEIAPSARLRVDLPRIQSVFPRSELADHR
jgi:hypothetical protein